MENSNPPIRTIYDLCSDIEKVCKNGHFDKVSIALSELIRGADLAIEIAVATERENCAYECEKRARKRFDERGHTELDTNASYYSGADADDLEARDEESFSCAAAIRART